MEETFRFNNRDDVVDFDNMLRAYLENKGMIVLDYYSLSLPYDKLPSKSFYSYFDIVINIILLDCDLNDCMHIWNKNFSSKKSKEGSVLDSIDIFSGKMDIHRGQSSFIFRYRATWDKIMGFLLLLFSPEDYDTFLNADSRKKSFKAIIINHLDKWTYLSEIIKIIDGPLMHFDDNFRTPEAHYTGRLRKWSFVTLPWKEDPTFGFYGYYNLLNHVMKEILKLLDEQSVSDSV
jgi:hypothetical protein